MAPVSTSCPDAEVLRPAGDAAPRRPDDDLDIPRQLDDETQRQRAAEEQDGVSFAAPDGGWGWVVCVTAMLTNGTVTGFLNTLSIIYVAMLEEFGGQEPYISVKTCKYR